MTTRLTLTVDVPDEHADRAEQLLRAIANGPAYAQRASIERRPLAAEHDEDPVTGEPWRAR